MALSTEVDRRRGEVGAHEPRSLAAVPAHAWNELAGPGQGALRHGYLRAWEHCELAGLRSRPIALSDHEDRGQLRAASPGYFYDLDVIGANWPQSAGALSVVRRLWTRAGRARTFELGSPTPLTAPFMAAEGIDVGRVVPELLDAALEAARDERAALLLVQNFASCEGATGDALRSRGFASVDAPTTAVLDLPFDSFDDYLNSMRAQYRRRARAALRRTEEFTVEHRVEFADIADDLAALWYAIYLRARELRREVLTAEVFRAMSALEDLSVLLVRRPDGSIASFALLLDDRPWLSFLQCGFEESAGRGEGAYFRLLYEIVRYGIEEGYREVELGMTTLPPKLDVGAVPVPLFAWVRHRNPLMQRVLTLAAESDTAPTPEPRHVFREPPLTAGEILARRGLVET